MTNNHLNLHIPTKSRFKELVDEEKKALQSMFCDVAKFAIINKSIYTIRGRKKNTSKYKNYLLRVHINDKRGFSTTKQKWYKTTVHYCNCHGFKVYEKTQFIKT